MNAPSSSSDTAVGPVSFSVNPKLSITRVGSRAYYKALEQLAPQIRLDLAQAEDARKFATNQDDPILRRYELQLLELLRITVIDFMPSVAIAIVQ